MNHKGKKVTFSILKASKKVLLLKVLTSTLIRASLLIIPIFWSKAVDYISNKNIRVACFYVFISLLVTVAYWFFEHINQKVFYKLYNKLYNAYMKESVTATYQNSMYSLSRFTIGEYSNICNTDVDVIAAFFSNNVIRVVRIFEFLFILGYFYFLDFNTFIVTALVVSILLIIFVNLINKSDGLNIVRKRKLDKKSSMVHEVFEGIKEIKGFNVFNKINERLGVSTKEYLDENEKYNVFYKKVKYIVLCIIEIFRYLIMLYSFYLVIDGKMLLGSVLLIYSYYGQLKDAFDVIGTFVVEYRNFKVSLNRFSKLLEYKESSDDRKYLPKKEYEGRIRFIDVLYGNRNDPILNNVCFEIEPNSINVITGKPGSGKTGVFDLLLKVNRKHTGTIFIDDDEYEKINPKNYYNLISLCRKDPFFFKISIKDNFAMIEKDKNKLIEICKVLNIHNYIVSLEDGYETLMIDSNKSLSTEIRQLLGIARVFLKDSKIMLFDEVLSSLDVNNQELVLKLLDRLKENHTIVIISREENIIKRADKVIYMYENVVTNVIKNN